MAKYEELCTQILEKVGGKDNITSAVHCMTRLRINFKDKSKIDVEATKQIKGVLGAQFSGAQFQVIIGQQVSDVYPEFCALAGIGTAEAIDENLDKEPFDIKKVPGKVLDYISGSIAPILPIMMGAGWFKMFYALLGPSLFNVLPESCDLMQILYIVGECGFYFMPVYVGYGAAKKLNTSIPLTMLLMCLLIDPKILAIVNAGEPFKIYGLINMPLNNYTQTIVPTLLTVWVLKYVYSYVNKIVPTSIKIIGVPLLTLFVMVPVMFCALAPVGQWVSVGFTAFFSFLQSTCGFLAVALIGGFWMYLVATGMHVAVIQIALLNITTLGYDPLVLAGSQAANLALMGMSVAYFLRTKGNEKALAGTNMVTLIVGGISEPTLFSVLIRNKRAMLSYTLGGLAGGLLIGITGSAFYTMGASNILCILGYAGGPGNNFLFGVLGCALAFVVALVVGVIFGFGDDANGLQNYKPRPKTKKA